MRTTDAAAHARHSRIGRALLAAVVLALVLVAPAGAAGSRKQSAFADTTRPVLFLKETVVTGSRYPRVYYESPQALSFVNRQVLREEAPIVLGDVLARIPGVASNQDSPWEQRPVIRGLTGQRVLVLVDGTPMNSVRGNGPHPSLVDPSQVDRIEVVRGPSAVAYGSDALGGVINIITRPAPVGGDGQFRGSATLGGSVAGLPERNGSLDFSTRWKRLSAFVSGGGRKAEDYKNADGPVPSSGLEAWDALANLRYDFTDRLALKGGYQAYRGARIGIPGLDVTVPGYSQSFNFKHYDRDFAHLTLEHQYPASSWLGEARINSYWQREHRNFYSDIGIDMSGPTGPSMLLALNTDRILDLDTYGLQAQMTSRKTELYHFIAGLDAARDITGGTNSELQTFLVGGTPASVDHVKSASVPTGRFDNYAGYVQGEFFGGPRWTVNAGGRYTHYRYRTDYGLNGYYTPAGPPGPPPAPVPFYYDPRHLDDDALSGSLGLVYTPVTDLHLTANVANGYREPNAQDLYFSGPGSVGYVSGDPALKPERSVSYDVGLRWGPRTIAVSGNVFYSTFKDLIYALPDPTPPPAAAGGAAYRYTNVASARMWGGEAEGEWEFHPQFTLRATVAGTVGDNTSRSAIQQIYGVHADRVPLELVPPFGGSGSLRWAGPGHHVWAEATTRYSWRTNRLPPVTPGAEEIAAFKKEWIVADLSVGGRLETGQRVVAGVRNLADRRYRPALASVVEPGRTFFISLSSDF